MKKKTKIYWAGFTDGKLYFCWDSPNADHACLYRTKKDAKGSFDDVRPVRIVMVKEKRK